MNARPAALAVHPGRARAASPARGPRARRRLVAALALAAALPLAAGCRSVPPPPFALESEHGTVRAHSHIAAEVVGGELDRAYPEVRASLVGVREARPEIWAVPVLGNRRDVPDTVGGYFDVPHDRIHLRVAWTPPKRFTATPEWHHHSRRLALTHELVHFLLDESWRTLPVVAEEGLCDLVAANLVPPLGAMARGLQGGAALRAFGPVQVTLVLSPAGRRLGPMHAVMLTGADDIVLADVFARRRLAADVEALGDDPWEAVQRALGFLVVRRIVERGGIATLHELCRRADAEGHDTVPFEWLARAAALPLEGETASGRAVTWNDAWVAACFELMDAETHRWVALDFLDLARDALADESLRRALTRQLGGDADDPERFLERVDATLWMSIPLAEDGIRFLQYPPQEGLAIRLDDVPEYRELVREVLGERASRR